MRVKLSVSTISLRSFSLLSWLPTYVTNDRPGANLNRKQQRVRHHVWMFSKSTLLALLTLDQQMPETTKHYAAQINKRWTFTKNQRLCYANIWCKMPWQKNGWVPGVIDWRSRPGEFSRPVVDHWQRTQDQWRLVTTACLMLPVETHDESYCLQQQTTRNIREH